MSTQLHLFFFCCAGLLAPALFADVNPDGSFSHSIPIELPAGRNGVQPKLALTYNSNNGNGMLGMGWSLSGLPAITRMNYGNGFNYGKAGFPADTYVGPEGRLIELGSGTGVYHTEAETWSRYEATGNCGNGPCSWKVTDRNGLLYHYGLTTNSRIVAKDADNNDIHSGAVRVWALERVEDLNGNYYTVTYKKHAGWFYDHGQYYPEKIDYTVGGNSSKNYAVSFFYDETSRPDKEISYAQSAYVKTNWRLSKIAVDYESSCFLIFTCSDRVRNYVLSYDTTTNIHLSHLIHWQEFNANNLALPPIQFGWTENELAFNSPTNWSFAASVSGLNDGTNQPRWSDPAGTGEYNNLIDMNGDGRPDRVFYFNYVTNGPGLWVAINNGTGFSTPTNWSFPESTTNADASHPRWSDNAGRGDYSNLIDMNGDNKPDRVFHYNYMTNMPGLWVAINNGSGFNTPTNWSFAASVSGMNDGTNQPYWSDPAGTGDYANLIDMNGDGKPDRVFYYNYQTSTAGLWVAMNNGAGFSSPTNWSFAASITGVNDGTSKPRWTDPAGTGEYSNLIDMDGDRKPDRVFYFNYTTNTLGLWVAINNGTGFNAPTNWAFPESTTSADASHPRWSDTAGRGDYSNLIDMNGDGRADRVFHFNYVTNTPGLWVALNNGTGFNAPTNWSFSAGMTGLNDGSNQPRWSDPAGSGEYNNLVDMDGDGKPDRVFYFNYVTNGPGLWVATNNGAGFNSPRNWAIPESTTSADASRPRWSDSAGRGDYSNLIDMNGDGRPDRVFHYNYMTNAPGLWVALNKTMTSSLSSIVSPSGLGISVVYDLSQGAGAAICIGTCAAPEGGTLNGIIGNNNSSPRHLVTSVTTTGNMDLDGTGGNDTFTTNYAYFNGRMTTGTIPERASLGFEKIKTTDANTGSYKIDTYRQDKPFHGRPLRTASYLANGTKVSETTFPALAQYYCDESGCNTYNALPASTPTQPQQIRPKLAAQLIGGESSATISTSFENGIAYAAKTEEVLSYDVYGNALSARQTIDGNGANRSTYKFAQYINDTATGRIIGLPFNEKVCLSAAACAANDGNFVSESNTYFDGNATTGVVGARKLVTKKESFLSTAAGSGVWVPETFTYDTLGNVTQKVDAQGITTMIAYDSDYKQYPLSVTRSHGSATSVTSYTYDYRFGKKLAETNHDDNLITIYSIDASGFVTSQQTQNGATILAKKSFSHSPFGTSPIWTQECTFYGATFTTTACRKKFTDALGRVYREEFPELVNGVETQRAIERRYKQNATDRREYASKPQDPAFDFTADFAALSFPGKWSESVSDNLGRATSARSHDNKTTSVSYQNAGAGTTPPGGSVACTVNTDVDGVKKRSCTDIGGKPSVVAEAYTGATETIVTYGYDSLNRLTSVSSPQGVTSITYVGRSQLQESIIDPVVGTTSYEYYLIPGAADFTKLKKETRPSTTAGTVITDLEYNAPFGRVSKSTKADSVTTYLYDETDLSYGKGRLTTMAHTVDGYTMQDRYSYNDRGETTNTTRRISHATETLCSNVNAMPCLQTFGSTKDELGRMKTMTYPDGKVSVVNYLPGSGKNVSSLAHDGITYATYSDYTFDVAPHVGKVSYGNGVEHAYTYKPENGLLSTTVIGKPAAQAYIDVAYEYNPNLNIQRITDNAIPFLTVSYQYDALNRLSTATWDPDGTEITRVKTYQFDNHGAAMSKGNLTRKDQRRLTYGAGKTFPVSDELWNEGASQWQANATYTWSANGNLLTKGPFTFTYDSNNMMKQAVEVDPSTGSGQVAQTNFFYDQSGQRFLKKHTRGGVTIKTWYLGDGIEVREKYVGVGAGTPDGTYDSSQSTKYIYGIDNKKLASITGTVYTAALSVSSSSMYALADSHSSSTVSGISGKVYYTFYGAYAHAASAAREFTAGQWRMIVLALVGLMLLVWLVLTHPLSPSLKKRGGSTTSPLPMGEGPGVRVALWQRATALGMVVAFFTVNCGSQLPSGVTAGQVSGLISDLYTGLPTGTVYYSHNHLGSGALVTDAAGNEVFRITYTEYGEIDLANSGVYNPATTNIEHTVDDAKIFITAVKYTGQEYDPETGMYYYNARYFDPQLGVFTTADSEVPEDDDSQSYNRHMYVRGNPIMYTDPSGHFFFAALIVMAISAAVSGGTYVAVNGKNSTLGGFLKAAGIGAAAGLVGFGVGAGVAAGFGAVAGSGVIASTVGSIAGSTFGGAAGSAAGYSLSAWDNCANNGRCLGSQDFWNGFGVAAAGGAIGGVVSGGLSEMGNFITGTGKLATMGKLASTEAFSSGFGGMASNAASAAFSGEDIGSAMLGGFAMGFGSTWAIGMMNRHIDTDGVVGKGNRVEAQEGDLIALQSVSSGKGSTWDYVWSTNSGGYSHVAAVGKGGTLQQYGGGQAYSMSGRSYKIIGHGSNFTARNSSLGNGYKGLSKAMYKTYTNNCSTTLSKGYGIPNQWTPSNLRNYFSHIRQRAYVGY